MPRAWTGGVFPAVPEGGEDGDGFVVFPPLFAPAPAAGGAEFPGGAGEGREQVVADPVLDGGVLHRCAFPVAGRGGGVLVG
jgi:hypothetical protein